MNYPSLILIFSLFAFSSSNFMKDSYILKPQFNIQPLTLGEEPSQAEKMLRDVSFSVKCMLVENFTVYDLTGMAKNRLDSDGKKDFELEISNTKIRYNFCYDLAKENRCNSTTGSQVAGTSSGNCHQLAGSIGLGNKWKVSKNLIEIDLNPLNNSVDVVKYRIECDENNTNKYPEFISSKSYYQKSVDGKKETLLYFKSPHGCPKIDFYTFWKFINDYDWIFAIILIVLGLFECILGNRLAKPTAFIITCAGVLIIVVILFFQFILPPGTATWIIWVILTIALVIGVFAGMYVAQNQEKCLAFVVGGVAGFFLGELLFNLFGNRFGDNLTYVHMAFIIVSIVVMMALAGVLSKLIIIISTSLIGAYATVRGISFFAGGFPSEFTVIDLARAGETEQLKEMLDWEMYAYLSAIIILTAISIYTQMKISKGKRVDVEGVSGGLMD